MTLDLKAGLSSSDFSPWHGLESLSILGGMDITIELGVGGCFSWQEVAGEGELWLAVLLTFGEEVPPLCTLEASLVTLGFQCLEGLQTAVFQRDCHVQPPFPPGPSRPWPKRRYSVSKNNTLRKENHTHTKSKAKPLNS